MPISHLSIEPRDTVLPCPFCGSDLIELWNTHRASYTVECLACNGQITGLAFGADLPSEKLTRRHHAKAKRSALGMWNRRATTTT